MTKVEKMKIERYITDIEEEIDTLFNDIASVEYFLKQLKRYIKASEIENKESEE